MALAELGASGARAMNIPLEPFGIQLNSECLSIKGFYSLSPVCCLMSLVDIVADVVRQELFALDHFH